MILATDEARRLRHDYIGTEHIFLGVLGSEGRAASVLADHGLTLQQAREDVPAALIRKPTQKGKGWIAEIFGSSQETPFTNDSKKLLEKALLEAQAAKQKLISDEHLLLALTINDGPGKDILIQKKIDLEKLRAQLLNQ